MQTQERDRLIEEHLPYSGAIATAFLSELELHGIVAYDDVIGYANLGLTRAANRFCADRGAQFKTFSFPHIRGAVIDGLRALHRGRSEHQQWKVAKHQSDERSVPLPSRRLQADRGTFDDADESRVDPFPALERMFLRADIAKALNQLPEIERQVIVLYYFEDLKHSAIATRMGHAPSYISRRRRSALRTLAKALRDSADDGAARQDAVSGGDAPRPRAATSEERGLFTPSSGTGFGVTRDRPACDAPASDGHRDQAE